MRHILRLATAATAFLLASSAAVSFAESGMPPLAEKNGAQASSPSLEGVAVSPSANYGGLWKFPEGDIAITIGKDGLVRGKQTRADISCGIRDGAEVLRGSVDGTGLLSGEIRICLNEQCPNLPPIWSYFVALTTQEGTRLKAIIAPSASWGCPKMSSGFSLEAQKMSGGFAELALSPSDKMGESASIPNVISEPNECAVSSLKGFLRLSGIPDNLAKLTVDGDDWHSQPFKRPVKAGAHTISIQLEGEDEVNSALVCVPGGQASSSFDIRKLFKKEISSKEAKPSSRSVSKRSISIPEKKIDLSEEDACPAIAAKSGAIRITLPNEECTVLIDDKSPTNHSRKKNILTLKSVSAGEHRITVRLSNNSNSIDEFKTVCVRPSKITQVSF